MRPTTRNLLIVIVILLVILGVAGWYIFIRPSATSQPTTATSTAPTTTPAVSTAPNQAAVPPQHIIEHGQYYDSDLQYPTATPLTDSTENAAAVKEMRDFVTDTLTTFKNETGIATITPQDAQIQGLSADNKYSLTNDYKTYYGAHTVSYAFSIYEDTMGAHPNTYFHTFTFDTNTGASLSLSDLFNSGSQYLSQLSTLTRASLTKQLGDNADPEFIDPGTTADATSFQNFIIDGSTLTILFPPYAVASYAQGSQSVGIPLSQLNGVLKASYQQ